MKRLTDRQGGIQDLVKIGDAQELLDEVPKESIDLVITDPPYERKYAGLWSWLPEKVNRVLKPGGSFISLCGHFNIDDIMQECGKHLRFWWLCGMAHPGNLNRMPGKWVCIRFKPAVWYVKERRFKGDTDSPMDLVPGDHGEMLERKQLHKWGQPINWYRHYIQMLTPENGIVLDPFAGSLTAAIAAKLDGRRYICFEMDAGAMSKGLKVLVQL